MHDPRHESLGGVLDLAPIAPDADLDVTCIVSGLTSRLPASADELLPEVYQELRAIARHRMNRERKDHTLQATALVHEAYMRLVGVDGAGGGLQWSDRGAFLRAAAAAMRRILVDHARRKNCAKRGGEDARAAALSLAGLPDLDSDLQSAGFLVLDDAISSLERLDSASASVVRLRYFAGLSLAETASALDMTVPSVKRRWAFARAWLKDAIESDRH